MHQAVYENEIYQQKAGPLKVVKYHGAKKVEIEFINTKTALTVTAQQIKKGTIQDKMAPTILNVGYHGFGDHLVSVSKVLTRPYTLWYDMLNRCYNAKLHTGKHSTYKNTVVDKRWHNFQNFAEWLSNNYVEGWTLDKDLKGSNIYSPDTCVYIPPEVNMAEAQLRKLKELDSSFTTLYEEFVKTALDKYDK